jgi:hypothetical protein
MPLRARKTGFQIRAHQFANHLRPHDPGPQTKHVRIVILHGLMRRKRVVAGARANPAKLVRSHARAHPAAAQQNAAFSPSALDRIRDRARRIGVIHRLRRARPEIDRFMPHLARQREHSFFHRKTGVIRRNCNCHQQSQFI